MSEGKFECRECEKQFASAKEFSDHFKRAAGSQLIVGCKDSPPKK